MADDLGDDWFVKEDIDVDQDSDDVTSTEVVKTIPKTKKKKSNKKRKIDETEEGDKSTEGTEKEEAGKDTATPPPEKKKKKKKKRPKKKNPNDENPLPSSAQHLWDYFEEEMKKELSELELSEIQPEEDEWFMENTEETNISSYLKNGVKKWKSSLKKHTESNTKASPIILIVSPGGQRAADILRETKEFRGDDCKCTKLFAKHFKVTEQLKYLKKNVVHLGVGTPNRILKLIEEDGLDLTHTKYIIVDWKWRDVKTRQISTMPGVKEDLANLFKKYLFKRCKQKLLQVGLF